MYNNSNASLILPHYIFIIYNNKHNSGAVVLPQKKHIHFILIKSLTYMTY